MILRVSASYFINSALALDMTGCEIRADFSRFYHICKTVASILLLSSVTVSAPYISRQKCLLKSRIRSSRVLRFSYSSISHLVSTHGIASWTYSATLLMLTSFNNVQPYLTFNLEGSGCACSNIFRYLPERSAWWGKDCKLTLRYSLRSPQSTQKLINFKTWRERLLDPWRVHFLSCQTFEGVCRNLHAYAYWFAIAVCLWACNLCERLGQRRVYGSEITRFSVLWNWILSS